MDEHEGQELRPEPAPDTRQIDRDWPYRQGIGDPNDEIRDYEDQSENAEVAWFQAANQDDIQQEIKRARRCLAADGSGQFVKIPHSFGFTLGCADLVYKPQNHLTIVRQLGHTVVDKVYFVIVITAAKKVVRLIELRGNEEQLLVRVA